MDEKITETVLKNAYGNVQMALLSLDDVIKIANGPLKEELLNEREGYEKLITDITILAHETSVKLPDVGAIKKTMLSASISMKTMVDDSDSKIAEMTLKGTITGITELIKDLSEFGNVLDEKTAQLLLRLKEFEEECEENLKKFL